MRPGRPPLTTAELEVHWHTLQEQPAQLAWQAMQAMIHQPDRSVPFLAKNLKPHPTLDRIHALIADLDADDFATRENASQALRNLGHSARPALEEAAKSNSLEQARRAKLILSSLRIHDLETLRLLRALEVLERIGSPDAVKVIDQFAQQTTGLIKNEALASLTRCKR